MRRLILAVGLSLLIAFPALAAYRTDDIYITNQKNKDSLATDADGKIIEGAGGGGGTWGSITGTLSNQTDLQNALDAKQPLDADLTSIAALGFTSTSFLKKTAANTWALDTAIYEAPLTFANSLSRATNTVTLLNDSASPGNSYYYGTNGSGTRGWYSLGGAGLGTVTSVAMTGDGVVFNSTVSGSPITTSGTLAPALLTKNANTVFAGPTSGGAATPTFRALVAADMAPAGANSYVQYNDTGVLGADANFTWDKTNKVITLTGGTSQNQLTRGLVVNNGNVATATGVFQVKGGTDANLIITDVANNRVGIGVASPTVKLDVAGSQKFGAASTDTCTITGRFLPRNLGQDPTSVATAGTRGEIGYYNDKWYGKTVGDGTDTNWSALN
jgi:hypothetical protein